MTLNFRDLELARQALQSDWDQGPWRGPERSDIDRLAMLDGEGRDDARDLLALALMAGDHGSVAKVAPAWEADSWGDFLP